MHINRKIENFLRQFDYPPTRFGRKVAGDPRLVRDMRAGRTLGAALIEKAESFMADYAAFNIAMEETA